MREDALKGPNTKIQILQKILAFLSLHRAISPLDQMTTVVRQASRLVWKTVKLIYDVRTNCTISISLAPAYMRFLL